jgi:hypothetical protein
MVMYLLMAAAYVLGGVLVGAGVYLSRQDDLPRWWERWMPWPHVEVTPRVVHLQGWAVLALGASVLALGFTPVVPEVVGGALVLAAIVAYVVGVALFVYSAYVSRRQTN